MSFLLKTRFALLLLLASLAASAQVPLPDSVAQKPVALSFSAKHLALIAALMPDRGTPEAINVINQMRAIQGTRKTYDTAHSGVIATTYSMVANLFFQIGSAPERLVAQENREIQDALIPQLMAAQYQDLLGIILGIKQSNAEQTERVRAQGAAFIMKINQ